MLCQSATVSSLVLGPLLRHVDETSATVWVETAGAGTVRVTAGEHAASARTFRVHDHHFALVCLDGLTKGTKTPYTVDIDDERVWPEDDSPYPASLVPTLDLAKPLRLAFGSCRTSVGHDAEGNDQHGVDALRAYALRMAGITDSDSEDPDPDGEVRWPDLVLFLGDQVYADETTQKMREFIESRRDIESPPGTELKDFEEYAHLYWLAWSDPANRWLLSTVPSAMIFDDHDIRDDWNTSQAWKDQMEATDWWHDRIVGGLAAYWVYQHLGNLTAAERAGDVLWQRIEAHEGFGGADELDLSDPLDEFAERADQEPTHYRWSYVREYGSQARLVVIDSRAARVLDPEHRSLLDEDEMDWLDAQMRGDVDHLLVGTSIPFLLAPGLHYVEAFSEALVAGGMGQAGGARRGEAAPGRRPRALGGLPGRLPDGGTDDHGGGPRPTRPGAADDHLPLRRRAPQLRLRGAADPRRAARGRPADQPDPPGRLLADPQPVAATMALRHGGGLLRGRRTPGTRRGPLGQGAEGADAVVAGARAVVRQQPGHVGGQVRRAAPVVGHRRGPGRRGRPPPPQAGRRGVGAVSGAVPHDRPDPAHPHPRCRRWSWPPPPPRAWPR